MKIEASQSVPHLLGVSKRSQLIDAKWALYCLIAITYSAIQITQILYVILATELVTVVSRRCSKSESISSLLVVALLMPDNYCIIAICVVLYIATYRNRHNNKSVLVFLIVTAYCALSVFIHQVPINNAIMWCIYLLPFPLLYTALQARIKEDPQFGWWIYISFKRFILLEAISIVAFVVFHSSVAIQSPDHDWVVGTLGTYQANILMASASFALLVFLGAKRAGANDASPWIVASLLISVSTTSVSYVVALLLAVMISYALIRGFTLNQRFRIGAGVIAGLIAFMLISPSWIMSDVTKMLNPEYAHSRFEKSIYYERTFVTLPDDHGVEVFLFGTGLGQYSSRAAMTCAGGYISTYDHYFEPYNAPARKEYLLDQKRFRGLASMADSSYIAIQGELGFFGLLLCIGLLLAPVKKSGSPYYITAILFFLGLMAVDNALEFAKTYTALCLAITALQKGSYLITEPNSTIPYKRKVRLMLDSSCL